MFKQRERSDGGQESKANHVALCSGRIDPLQPASDRKGQRGDGNRKQPVHLGTPKMTGQMRQWPWQEICIDLGNAQKQIQLRRHARKKEDRKSPESESVFRSMGVIPNTPKRRRKQNLVIGNCAPGADKSFPFGHVVATGVGVGPSDGASQKRQFDPAPKRQR